MNHFLARALELSDMTIENRRYIHENPGLGFNLEDTVEYVTCKLKEYGLSPKKVGRSGISAAVGKSGPTILLRADMDALPLEEKSGLPFKSKNEGISHCCGHDLHAAMLLTAAKMLKENEKDLKGQIKFMFQPAEEIGQGAKDMIEEGILEDPKPDAVLALHVDAKAPLGRLDYGLGPMFASSDNFSITIHGEGAHAARPHEGKDPILIGFHLYNLIESFKTHGVSGLESLILTVTAFESASSFNVLPETATMKGTLRTYDEKIRRLTTKKLKDIIKTIEEYFEVEITLDLHKGLPPLSTSVPFTQELLGYAEEIVGDNINQESTIKMGSEDFSEITKFYPETSAYFSLGAGLDSEQGFPHGQHNPKVIFNEDMLPLGAALLANLTSRWLENQ